MFNILLIINTSFFIWILSKSDVLKKNREFLEILLITFITMAICNLLFFQGFYNYNSYTELTADLFLAFLCLYFFYLLLKEEAFRNLLTYEYFWLANGLLLFSFVGWLLYFFYDQLKEYYKETHINVGGTVNDIINLLFYASLIISFVCRRRTLN